MPRGQAAPDGSTRVAPNGYHYTKVAGRGWVLTHWLVAEKARGGQEIDPKTEMVRFKGSRRDLSPDNILIIPKNQSTVAKRIAQLEARRDELDAEIALLRAEQT